MPCAAAAIAQVSWIPTHCTLQDSQWVYRFRLQRSKRSGSFRLQPRMQHPVPSPYEQLRARSNLKTSERSVEPPPTPESPDITITRYKSNHPPTCVSTRHGILFRLKESRGVGNFDRAVLLFALLSFLVVDFPSWFSLFCLNFELPG